MSRNFGRHGLAALLVVGLVAAYGQRAWSADQVTQAEYEKLKKEVEDLRKKLSETTPVAPGVSAVDRAIENKYGPNAPVTARQGKLTLGGLVQVWYYSIQNDNISYFDVNGLVSDNPGIPSALTALSSNEVADNDSFRVRRAELKFTMDIHENVTAVVMIDPAREAASFPCFPSNLGSGMSGDSDVFYAAGWWDTGHVRNSEVREGAGLANRILQDAYINFHGVIPHHDVTVGQMKRRLGEEGTRDSATLDFAERAMITQMAELRDLGLQIHGTWWDDRFQYWLGVYDGAGTAFQQRQNRADDNDEKDLVGAILIRPLWKDETWGSIELGYSILWGRAGEAAGHYPEDEPVDGLNRNTTTRIMQYAWASYMPGGPVKGWWLRGEWGQYRDRFAPGTGEVNSFAEYDVKNPAPFNVQGWYVATGYKLQDSIWADGLNKWVKPMEFTFRYETMKNLFVPDLVHYTRRIDVFATEVFTAGINYYIKGHNAKLQLNYNWVDEEVREGAPTGVVTQQTGHRYVREVRNDNFVVNFQVGW
jgi:hypothetical protein